MDDAKFTELYSSKGMDAFGAALDDQGFVYTWGQNSFGQLG
jgi:alpha-tubulin suppressor-like RCC1 family protein